MARRGAKKSGLPVILVGNKVDLKKKRNDENEPDDFLEIVTKEGEQLSKKLKCAAFVLTSCQSGKNVNMLFDAVAAECVRFANK